MDLLIRFITGLLILVHWIYSYYKSWKLIITKEKNSVTPSVDPVLHLTALSLAQKIRERKILSQEVVQKYINRIKEVNPIINAVVEDRFEDALKDAKEIDRYLDQNPHKINELKITKPLFGIPITIKESIAVKGLSYTGGTLTRKNIKAVNDSVVVQYLKEAGVIPLLVSNTPEYCTSGSTFNKITGYTCNPYNTHYSSGGSSGGEAALLGAGASLIGIGSDIVGSIRLPAMFCGVFGHKPTNKIVPLEGHWPLTEEEVLQSCLVIGPLTRYAEDLKPLLKILFKPNNQSLGLDEKVDLSKVVVFYMEDTGNNFCLPATDKKIKTAIKTAVAYLCKECHCHTSNHKFMELADSIEIGSVNLLRMKTLPTPLRDTEKKYNLCWELIKGLFGKSIFTMEHLVFLLIYHANKHLVFGSEKYVRKLDEVKKALEILGDNGVLIYPCMSSSARILGNFLMDIPSLSYASIPNLLGLPATAVPTGFDSHKMPIGIQIIAGRNQDRLTLAIAEELEKCFGGWQAVP